MADMIAIILDGHSTVVKTRLRCGEMLRMLRLLLQRTSDELPAPTWDSSQQSVSNSGSRGSDELFRLLWVPGMHMVHI